MPGNVGPSYVLRMIIRRAARFGKGLGFVGPFLASVAEVVIEEMGSFFTELTEGREHILSTLTAEEERFQRTLDTALAQLDSVLAELESADKKQIDGETAFDLYATHGLPLEISRDVAKERGYLVDEEGYRTAFEAHKLASGIGAIGFFECMQPHFHHFKLMDQNFPFTPRTFLSGATFLALPTDFSSRTTVP